MQINSSAKLQTYCLFKHDTDLAKYLDLITNCKYKLALSRFRLSSHNLAIETGDTRALQEKIDYVLSAT